MRQRHLKEHPEIVLRPEATMRDAMEALTKSGVGIALIVDASKKLQGIIVDSDIRRALLAGSPMDAPVVKIMNPKPFTAPADMDDEALGQLFRERNRAYIPLVDKEGRLAGLAGLVDHLGVSSTLPNWTVVMAGGLGKRLRPLTDNTPKPLMRVGDKPILEHNVERLVAAGLTRMIFSINYLGEQIKAHFGDGARWGAQIEYITEDRELGTAGPLSLIGRALQEPFLVMNADLLTKVGFRSLLDYHRSEGHQATLCVREYDFQVPYGVAQMENGRLTAIVEKPVHKFFVNAGIYVLDPSVLAKLKRDEPRDMPDLLESLRAASPGAVGCFPVSEYWLDIGQLEDYRRAQREYPEQFGPEDRP